MYARVIEGRELVFGVSGKLIMNALVMYDRETDSLWSQFPGVAVKGPLAGTLLEPIGTTLTEWATWRELHPDTLVLDQRRLRRDQYSLYYEGPSPGILGETNRDDRLDTKEFVIGLQLGDLTRAYPFRYLNSRPLVHDRLGETELLVVFDADSATGVIFDRTLDGRALSFDVEPGDSLLMRDRETGTVWSGLTGEALSGPLAGEQLERLPSFPSFWFAWADFFPGAELFEGESFQG